MKNNPIPEKYQLKQINIETANKSTKTMLRLPQTQEELDELSMDSADYQIKEYIKDLFLKNRASKQAVLKEILKFFSAYDASRDLNILVLKKQFIIKKKENQRLKTY